MIALDTNILVRVLTRDDLDQAEVAAELMKSGGLFICKIVLLELEWVLRFAYGFGRSAIHSAFAGVLGLPDLQVEDEAAVTSALRYYGAGMDFADALHLCSSAPAVSAFATFDRALARKVDARSGAKPVRLLRVGA